MEQTTSPQSSVPVYQDLTDKQVVQQMLDICHLLEANRLQILGPEVAAQPALPPSEEGAQ